VACTGPNPNQCTDCVSSFLKDNICMINCGNHFYSDKFLKECKACDETCLTCTDGLATSCIKCNVDHYRKDKLCVKDCDIYFFHDAINCIPCHNSCKTCSEEGIDKCLSCENSFLFEGYCEKDCTFEVLAVYGYFGNSDNKCTPCDSSCKTCTGASPE